MMELLARLIKLVAVVMSAIPLQSPNNGKQHKVPFTLYLIRSESPSHLHWCGLNLKPDGVNLNRKCWHGPILIGVFRTHLDLFWLKKKQQKNNTVINTWCEPLNKSCQGVSPLYRQLWMASNQNARAKLATVHHSKWVPPKWESTFRESPLSLVATPVLPLDSAPSRSLCLRLDSGCETDQYLLFFFFSFFLLLPSAYSKHKLQSHHTLMAVCGAGAHSVSVLLSASGTRFISNGHIAAFAAYTADRRLSISFTLPPPPPALPSPVPPTSWAVQRRASARISLLLYCLFRMHMMG